MNFQNELVNYLNDPSDMWVDSGSQHLAFDPMDSDTYDYAGEQQGIPPCMDQSSSQYNESQAQHDFNSYQMNQNQISEPEPEDQGPCHIFGCLDESRQWFEENGVNPRSLSRIDQDGLIIIPLQCYSLIRNTTTKSCKPCPHIIVIPNNLDFDRDHNDFSCCIHAFYN